MSKKTARSSTVDPNERLRQLFHFTEKDLQKNELGVISQHQHVLISKTIARRLIRELSISLLLLALFLWLTTLVVERRTIVGLIYFFSFVLAAGIPIRRALKTIKTVSNGNINSVTDDISPIGIPTSRQKVDIGHIQLTPKIKRSELPDQRGFYRIYFIDELKHILSAEYLGEYSEETRTKFNNNGLFPTEHINESLRELFDYSEKELIENQNGRLSNRQLTVYRKLARNRLLPDLGLSMFIFGIFPLIFNEFMIPESRFLLARTLSIIGLIVIVLFPIYLNIRRQIAIKNNQIFQKITHYNSNIIFNAHENNIRPGKLSLHSSTDLFRFNALKGFHHPKEIYASVVHLQIDPLKQKKDPLKATRFQEHIAQTLMQHFSFTQEDLQLNQAGKMSQRQRKQLIKSFIPAFSFFLLFYILILAMVIYVPKEGGVFELLIIIALVTFIPVIVGLYLFQTGIPALRASRIESVSGPIRYHRHKKAVFLKIGDQQLSPMIDNQHLPDPTGIYRFYYFAGLNHVLSVEYLTTKSGYTKM